MAKLRLSSIPSDKPIKLSVELPAMVHRDLLAYAEILAGESGQPIDPARLIPHMLDRFMATDRGFVKAKRARRSANHTSSS